MAVKHATTTTIATAKMCSNNYNSEQHMSIGQQKQHNQQQQLSNNNCGVGIQTSFIKL